MLYEVITREPLAGSADGVALFVQQAAYLANHQDILALVVAAVTALYRAYLVKFLLPVTQDMSLEVA